MDEHMNEHIKYRQKLRAADHVTRIKRVAQFLFDNAELIAIYLNQSDNFRTVELDLRCHKALQPAPNLDIEFLLYDETAGLHDLKNHLIIKERFSQLCKMINEETEVISLPEPVEVRDVLEPGDEKQAEEAYNDSPEID